MEVPGLFNLTGKTALVTGCTNGIGLSMAIALAEAGADIIGMSRSDNSAAVANAIAATGSKFSYYQVDASDRKALYNFLNALQQNQSEINILVNNAGIILRNPAADHGDELWDEVMAVNLDAQFILAREIGKKMLQRGSGKIIFTCSLLSFQGGINVPGYTAAKSAIAGLVKALSNEWAGKGVGVNGIAPGYIHTNNTKQLSADAERNAAILSRIPAGRWGEPEDFKGAVVFLASPASDYVHGTILVVDGGWMGR
jgi:2-dehydro-3-deoxy-D-gluconate 5-dehydrogenase